MAHNFKALSSRNSDIFKVILVYSLYLSGYRFNQVDVDYSELGNVSSIHPVKTRFPSKRAYEYD